MYDVTFSTSPALSLDGTKVAFVETAPGTSAHFHVLAWAVGDGVDGSDAQNVLLPVTIDGTINAFVTQSPVAGSGTATDLALGGGDSDTLSSPFVDYAFDYAYVGTDNGNLYRIQDVFCTVNPLCLGGTPPQPTLDSAFGEGGEVAVCPGLALTGPVEDPVTGNVFVGCSNGNLYGFTSAGIALANSPLSIGDSSGTPGGGMIDPPLIDAVNGFVYAVSGAFEGNSVIVQTKTTDLSFDNITFLGQGNTFPLHAPAFNDAYFSSVTPSDWRLYEFALDGDVGDVALFGATFDASHNMNGGISEFIFPIGSFELSPVTEFLNGVEDRLFNSTLLKVGSNFVSMNITTAPAVQENLIDEPASGAGGTSGIVIDNVGTDPQESSIYFSVLSVHTAVKLTQAGLQ